MFLQVVESKRCDVLVGDLGRFKKVVSPGNRGALKQPPSWGMSFQLFVIHSFLVEGVFYSLRKSAE